MPGQRMQIISIGDLRSGAFSRELEGRDCGSPGLSLIVVDAEPGQGPSLHTHPYAEVLVVQSGHVTFTDGVSTYEASAGQVVVIPAGQPHAFENTSPEPLRQIDIHAADAFSTQWLVAEPEESA